MDEQEAPEKTRTWEGSIQDIKARSGNLGGIEKQSLNIRGWG